MASFVYKDYLIVARPEFDYPTGLWTMTVNVSWDFDGDHGCNLLYDPVDFFEAKDEAEQCGFEIGSEWIDKRSFLLPFLSNKIPAVIT
jgi:hypothetical protein